MGVLIRFIRRAHLEWHIMFCPVCDEYFVYYCKRGQALHNALLLSMRPW